MPIIRDPELDRLLTAHEAAWNAKLVAEKKSNGFAAVVAVIAQELRSSRGSYRIEIRELSEEVGRLQREARRNSRYGAPRVAKKKLAEADKLLERRNCLVRERDVVRLLLESTNQALQRADEVRAVCQREWEVAHAELESFKQRRKIRPSLAALIMDSAGVPVAHQNDALIKHRDGKYHIYFGGKGEGVGPGHGHFVFNPLHGKNVYTRMPTVGES